MVGGGHALSGARKSLGKEESCERGLPPPREDLGGPAQARAPASWALRGQLAQDWDLWKQGDTAPLWAQASGLHVDSPPSQTGTPSSGQRPRTVQEMLCRIAKEGPLGGGSRKWAGGLWCRGSEGEAGRRPRGWRLGAGHGKVSSRGWFMFSKVRLGSRAEEARTRPGYVVGAKGQRTRVESVTLLRGHWG